MSEHGAGADVRDLVERYVDALNARRIDRLADLVADELTHNGERMSRQEWWDTQVVANTAAVPDLRWTVDEVVVTGDRAVVRYTDSGTPTTAWMGLEPTGAPVRFREYVLYIVRDGRISEVWGLFDATAIREQLGPTSSSPTATPTATA